MKAITTGVFQVPQNNPLGPNNTINVIFKNPGSKPLSAGIFFEFSLADYGTQKESSIIMSPITVAPHSTFALDGEITSDHFYRISFWGDIDRNEMKNKLSVEIIIGTRSGTGAILSSADANVLFRHENFVDTDIQLKGRPLPCPNDFKIMLLDSQ